MVSTIQGHKMVTLKMSYFMTNIVLVKRLGKIWMNFAIFSPLVSFISNWQNTMKSHIISNKYITDENPLKLGYLEIWGVGSVPISSVSVSANDMVITPPFTYSSATQVCDREKSQWNFPALRCLVQFLPACLPKDTLFCWALWEFFCGWCVSTGQLGDEGITHGLSFGAESPGVLCLSPCLQTYMKLCLSPFTSASEICFLKSLELLYFIK